MNDPNNYKSLNQQNNSNVLQTPRQRMNLNSNQPEEQNENSNNLSDKETYNPYLSHKQPLPKSKKPVRQDFNKPEPVNKKRKEQNSNYRDRAAERRQNINPDYEQSEQIIQNLENGLDRDLAYHQSKYLGGDVEHTHLVKGLDFVLLEKMRKDIQEKDPDYREITDDDLLELYANIEQEKEKEISNPQDEQPVFHSKFAESIYNNVFSKSSSTDNPKVNDLFIPGRMSYHFEIKNTGFSSLIPSTNVRSKASLSKTAQYLSNSSTHNNIVDKVVQLFGYIRLGNRGLKTNQSSTYNLSSKLFDDGIAFAQQRSQMKIMANAGIQNSQPVVPASHSTNLPDDDDNDSLDDMFGGDGGDYQLDVQAVIEERDHIEKELDYKKRQHEIFARNHPNDENHPILPNIIDKQKQGISTSISQAYEDHMDYDGAHSDDDFNDHSKKKQLTKWDFDNEADWEEYKNQQTIIPKAALKYGSKSKDK